MSRSDVAITEDPAARMNKIISIAPGFAVTSAMEPDDFAQAAALGFRAIINNRPDGEDPYQLTAADEALLAATAGMGYAHVPASKLELFSDSVVEPMQRALAELDRPILAHCQSGVRSAIAWAAVSARDLPVDAVLAHLKEAGFDLEFLHDDLDAQADRANWNEPSRRTTTSAVS
ncbi:MAG: TIGR01244 family phosphatase [Hyphomicrobium sp.]|nr:MAG: TIGR01244 family phosphatase [Hyphomicrobium sp.]